MKFKVGDEVKWTTEAAGTGGSSPYVWGIGTILGIGVGDRLHLRFDGFEYEDNTAWRENEMNLYDGLDYHTAAPHECMFAFNGLQRAIKKAKNQ